MSAKEQAKPVLDAELTAYIEALIDRWGIVGLSLCVVRPDSEVEFGGYGVMDDEGTPVTPDTLFGIASISKAFSAFALAQVMEDYDSGRNKKTLPSGLKSFDWNTPVKKLLPDVWQLQDEFASERAAPIDIVSHVSGLAGHDMGYAPTDTAEDVVKRMRYLAPNRDLREEWQYNNTMYMANQCLVAALSGQPYTEFVKERLLKPVGMSHSTFTVSEVQATGKFSRGFTWVGPDSKIKRSEPHFIGDESIDLLAGAGGIISNVQDMSKWLKVLLAKGVIPETKEAIVPEADFKYLTAGRYIKEVNGAEFPETSTTAYGGGWQRYSYQGHEIVHHTGGTPGISNYLVFLPNDNFGMCLFSNTGSKHPGLLSLIHRIVENVLGLKQIDWSERLWKVDAKQKQEAAEKKKPRTADAALPLDLSAYCGTFSNPAYGSFTLHSPSSPSSAEARKVVADFATVDASPSAPFPDDAQSPQLFAAYPRIWGSHLRLRHQDGQKWSATFEKLYPEGSGKDKTPFVRIGTGPFTIEFVVDDGSVKGLDILESTIYPTQRKKAGDESRTIPFSKTA